MKKLFSLMLSASIILAACSSSKPSMTEVENVPKKVQQLMEPEYTLQLMNKDEKESYIILQSKGTVSAELEEKGDVLNIKFNEENQKNKTLTSHVYHLNRGNASYDKMKVYVNGKETSFDSSSGL